MSFVHRFPLPQSSSETPNCVVYECIPNVAYSSIAFTVRDVYILTGRIIGHLIYCQRYLPIGCPCQSCLACCFAETNRA